jgi:hypothetical protein
MTLNDDNAILTLPPSPLVWLLVRSAGLPLDFSQNSRSGGTHVIYTEVSASACAFSVPFVLTCRLENRQVSFHP